MSIPRQVFQVWVGSKIPDKFRDWGHRLSQVNRGWEYRLHGDELLDRYRTDPIIQWMLATDEKKAFVVDRLRVLLLRDDGGIYLDCDCFPCKPLDTLKCWDDPRVQFVAGIRPPDRQHVTLHSPGVSLVDNTVLASAPQSMMSKRLCDLYNASSRKQNGMSMGREILRNVDESCLLLNWRYFYALQEEKESIVLHDGFNSGSWVEAKPKSPFVPC